MDNTLKLISLDTRVGKIRFSDIGEPLFMGTDVAKALKFKSHRYAVQKYCTQEKKLLVRWDDSMTMAVPCILIPLSDVRNLEQHADAAAVQAFEVVLTNEILPKLRQVQKYEPETVQEAQEPQEQGALQVFTNESFGSVRTLTINNEPYFVGRDVAEVLGYAKARNAIAAHVDEEDKKDAPIQCTPGGVQEMTVINESGLYSLILGSKLPKAREFKRWITHEVIPSIRKTGGYLTPAKVEEVLLNPDTIIKLATDLKEARAKMEEMKPKALFADAVSTAETSILVGELAKLIKQNGVDMGEKRLFEWMRGNGYLISRNGIDRNMPTQKSMELGLMEIKERAMNNPDGSVRITKTPKVTGKGQVYFVNKFIGKEL